MKKKIVALAAALMMFAGVVSASSINGDYKGNPIVKVTSNGKQLETDEVPAMIYDGHTVVPISLLRQIGASVEWNADTYSVDVKLPSSQGQTTNNDDVVELSKIIEVMRGIYSFEEQFALAGVISTGIAPNVTTKDDYKTLSDALERLNTDVLKNWLQQFKTIGVGSSDINTLSDAVDNLILAKSNLRNLDTKSATENINQAKGLFNSFAQKFDSFAKDKVKLH